MTECFFVPDGGCVTSLDIQNNSDLFYCGCDNGTVVLIDPNSSQNSTRKLAANQSSDVASITTQTSSPFCVHFSCGTDVYQFDIRNDCAPSNIFHHNSDEINKITIHSSSKYLAACDDSGEVKIINIDDASLYRTLKNQHSNICSDISFNCDKSWQLISSGLDSNIIMWDFHSCRARYTANLSELEDHFASTQLISPPLAHTVDISPDNDYVCCGAEDGSIYFFILQKRWLEFCGTLQAHCAGISKVKFFRHPNDVIWLVSISNDSKIKLWNFNNIRDSVENEKPFRLSSFDSNSLQNDCSNLSFREIDHGCKMNDICPVMKDNHLKILVADITNHVKQYNIDLAF